LRLTGLLVLEGDFGSGKSVTAERIFGADIASALDDDQAPAPVFLAARFIMGPLIEAAQEAAAGLGDPARRGARLVIDGLDEPGPARSAELLNEARSLIFTWPGTRVIITARPGLALQDSERFRHPLLSDVETVLLAQRLRGNARVLESASGSARAMLRLPLFLIVALLRGFDGPPLPWSRGMFLEALADAALDRSHAPTDKASAALLTLARLATRSAGPVPSGELGGRDTARWVLETRLVVRSDRSLRFALPVVEQYFAARSALENGLDEADLDDLQVLDRWLDPLTLALRIGSWQEVSALLDALTPRYPGLTSRLLATALPSGWIYDSTAGLPSALESARRIRHALAVWASALGPISELLNITDHSGQARTVGATIDDEYITFGLLVCENQYGIVQPPTEIGLPDDVAPAGYQWDLLRTDAPAADFAVWPWHAALQMIGEAVETVIDEELLDLHDSKPFLDERRWQMGKELTWRNARDYDPLLRSDVRRSAEELLASVTEDEWYRSGVFFSREKIKEFLHELTSGTLSKDLLLPQPYGQAAAVGASGASDADSAEPLRLLVEQVYTNALQIYEDLVASWFPGLVPMLGIASMLPVLIRGQLRPVPGRDPDFSYYMEPLPQGERSRAEVHLWVSGMEQIGEIANSFVRGIYQTRKLIAGRRPGAEGWAHPRTKDVILPVWETTPAITLAHYWLRGDLQSIEVIERPLFSGGY
jgi:hypothetical protein